MIESAGIGTPWLWAGFVVGLLGLLALDLGVFNRRPHRVGLREAAGWSAFWVALSVTFGLGVYAWAGPTRGGEFFAAYLLEKALSVDNIFVFVVLFGAFNVAPEHRHRVLFYGILGALAMRAALIAAGTGLIHASHATIYVFGALLLWTGAKMLRKGEGPSDPLKNPLVRLFRRVVPVAEGDHGGRFLVRRGGRTMATPLMVVLVAVEATDLIFALDSIPAVFAVTADPFVVFTSNALAVLGLRSLYFLLAGAVDRLRFLHVGLSLVLIFVGAKMLASGFVHVPVGASLGVVATLLGGAVAASLLPFGRAGAGPGVLPEGEPEPVALLP